jgi:hypothetical protein
MHACDDTEGVSPTAQEANSGRIGCKPEAILNHRRTMETENDADDSTPRRRHIMEAHQVDILASAVLGNFEQVENA